MGFPMETRQEHLVYTVCHHTQRPSTNWTGRQANHVCGPTGPLVSSLPQIMLMFSFYQKLDKPCRPQYRIPKFVHDLHCLTPVRRGGAATWVPCKTRPCRAMPPWPQ